MHSYVFVIPVGMINRSCNVVFITSKNDLIQVLTRTEVKECSRNCKFTLDRVQNIHNIS